MLSEDQKRNITNQVKEFLTLVDKYCKIKENAIECEGQSHVLEVELSEVADEERRMETAIDVLYRQTTQYSKTKEIEVQIAHVNEKLKDFGEKLNQLQPELLQRLRSLPLPINLEKFEETDDGLWFSYFEGLELGEWGVSVISELIRQEQLTFNDVTILPDKVMIKNTDGKDDAIQKLVAAIQTFRIRVDDLSKSYENIDVLIERLAKSKIYPAILQTIGEKGPFSVQEITRTLDVDERIVYDGCYNLTRSNWSPAPIQKLPSGQYQLTLAGKILVDRLFAKHPELKSQSLDHRQSDGVPNQ